MQACPAGRFPGGAGAGSLADVSNAAHHDHDGPHGTSLLPADLSEEQLAAAPVLGSVDALLIDGLTAGEDESFAAALSS